MPWRLARTALVALLLLVLVAGGATFAFVCGTPVDVSGRGVAADIIAGEDDPDPQPNPAASLPRVRVGSEQVHRVFRSDLWRWPAHRGLAAALQATHCNSASIALQWLKAGAHARTPDQFATAGMGLRQAIASAPDPADLQTRVCVLLREGGYDSPRLQAVQTAAGLACRP